MSNQNLTKPKKKDAYSGRDTGASSFDEVEEKTETELETETLNALLEISRNQYIYDVLDPLGYLDKILNIGISYNQEIPLATYVVGNTTVDISTTVSKELYRVSETDFSFAIAIDNTGNLTAGCQDAIASLTSDLDLGDD